MTEHSNQASCKAPGPSCSSTFFLVVNYLRHASGSSRSPFGSFGDILEAAKIAKRIIDVLRREGGSCERLRLISTLQHICDYMSRLTVLPDAHLTTRLRDEVGLCCSLLDRFQKKIKSHESFLGRIWMVASEEKELASWRVQISERRDALRDFWSNHHSTIARCRRTTGTGGISGSICWIPIDNVKAHIQNEVGTLGVFVLSFSLTAIHKILPRNISDPSFMSGVPWDNAYPFHCPPITSLMILRAYCSRPDAGSRYIERGDYSIVSTDGAIIPRLRLRGELKAGIEFDMSIIQRTHSRPAPQECHHCGHTDADAVEATWVNCRLRRAEPDREEGQAESFRLVQIFYRRKRGVRKGKGAPQSPLSPKDETLGNLAALSQVLAHEISRAAGHARRPSSPT
ncbi:hypothetical protein B0H17DRAFT_1155260 [Mycena rosella]|uniref:Uncharacterized protein n=1 Tax=Mycena rosella TaxID=1033263 RepID=A0AAD7AWH4_MYCRO|nr:hypothetical protein B0H17DRAFT_1155260 [Mycena rosella]